MARKGFTLIEVMVSMVILSVGLLAVLKMGYIYVQSNTQNLQRGQASVLAQSQMEILRSYAVSDRVDKFSVFDFDYVVSEDPTFTTVYDPNGGGSNIDVPGLISGSAGGATVTTPWNTVYEVLYDDGTHGDVTSGDGKFSNSDVKDVGGGQKINILYSVEPFYYPNRVANPKATYATLEVTTSWTDKAGADHSIFLKSVINRRQ